MSTDLATFYSAKYAAGIELLAQQLTSMTDGTHREEPLEGERQFFDQVGVVKMQERVSAGTDIAQVQTPLARRSVAATPYIIREIVDNFERLKVMNDPINSYTETFAAAGKRNKDKMLIDAALGTAYTGKTGSTAVPLPTAQKVAVATSGFTLAKLKSGVKKIKSANAVAQGEKIHVYWTSYQEDEFINTTEVKSSDFNNTKVMVDGELKYFYGCHFHRIEDVSTSERMLPLVSTTRSCVMWAHNGMLWAPQKPLYGRVDWLPEKESFQVVTGMAAGVTRMQETKVVQIDCVES